jgi:membrane associated rhomboid family serine protease
MFLPLYDANPIRTIARPYVTYGLIAANVLIFLVFQSGFLLKTDQQVIAGFAFTPALLRSSTAAASAQTMVPEPLTLITYMFLHGSWMHLIGNMLFLWVFGDNVEDDMGHLRYLAFYLLVGIGAGLSHAVVAPDSVIPVIGASGAISGIVIAYAMFHPRVKLWVLMLMRIPLKLSAMWVIAAWVVLQIVGLLTADANDNTAWWVHIGGIITGAALVPFLRRPGVPLFDFGPKPLPSTLTRNRPRH